MPTVTRLVRAGEARTRIELDGAPWRTVPTVVVAEVGLAVDCKLTRPLARRLRTSLRRHAAVAHAEQLLGHSERSAANLATALEARGVGRGERETLVNELQRSGLLSDTRTALRRAATLAERGWGNAAIKQRLDAAGFQPQTQAEAIEPLDDELERARSALARKTRTPAQAARFLSQRGFDPDVCETLFDQSDPMEG